MRMARHGVNAGFRLLLVLMAGIAVQAAHAESIDTPEFADEASLPTAPDILDIGAQLQASGAVIGQVTIDNQNIFDLDDPAENKWLYRLMNRAHWTTRPEVIRSQLLFESGEAYSQQQIDETERLLRSSRYIADATVSIVKHDEGVVDLAVNTQDVWTTQPDFSFGRKGGVNVGGVGLKEQNLLGTGIYIGAKARRTVDRDTASLEFANRNLRGSWYTLAGRFASNSDGFDRQLSLVKPFYSLDALRSQGALLDTGERTDTLYNLGEPQVEFSHALRYGEIFRGWSAGIQNTWTRRVTAGLVFDQHRFSPVIDGELPAADLPEDRQFFYPYLGFELVEDVFEKTKNIDQIERTEDRHLGRRIAGRIGYSPANDVSTKGTTLFRGAISQGWRIGDGETLIGGIDLSGRFEGVAAANTRLSAFAKYHKRQSDRRLFYAHVAVMSGDHLDADDPVVLGGATGLRGYPLRYQGGTGRALLTLEQRFFTDWYPFRLFRVGGAAFFDVGRTWGANPAGGDNLGLLKNVGLGLRIANTRSSVGRILHLDIAYPLDGEDDISRLQFLIETKRRF